MGVELNSNKLKKKINWNRYREELTEQQIENHTRYRRKIIRPNLHFRIKGTMEKAITYKKIKKHCRPPTRDL